MTLSVLISCMRQKDWGIVERTNVQTDCVVVNQCDCDKVEEFTFANRLGRECKVKFISTTERGLSRSRNMAIRNSTSDVCLICDDDEWLENDYEHTILSAYEENSKADVIAFALIRKDVVKTYPAVKKSLGFIQILKTSSLQISFKRDLQGRKNISFDEKMGSGTGNGAGEENKFLLDCRRAKCRMLYYPGVIATVNKAESQWFKGYDEKYFFNHGWSNRRSMGGFLSLAYILYYTVSHYSFYSSDVSFLRAFVCELKGWSVKR